MVKTFIIKIYSHEDENDDEPYMYAVNFADIDHLALDDVDDDDDDAEDGFALTISVKTPYKMKSDGSPIDYYRVEAGDAIEFFGNELNPINSRKLKTYNDMVNVFYELNRQWSANT